MSTSQDAQQFSFKTGAHLSRLIIDLQSQFSGGGQDEGDWVLLTTTIPAILLWFKECLITANPIQGLFLSI